MKQNKKVLPTNIKACTNEYRMKGRKEAGDAEGKMNLQKKEGSINGKVENGRSCGRFLYQRNYKLIL